MMRPTVMKKPNVKADTMAALMDQKVIADVAAPKAPPTLSTAQRQPSPQMNPAIKPMGFGGGASPQVRQPTAPQGIPSQQRTTQAGGVVKPTAPAMPAGPVTPTQTMPGATRPAEQPAAPATQDDLDAMIRSFVEDRLRSAGNVDTTEQEALIRQQMEGKLGSSLVDQRARMGRAGFGASGATAALESDARTAASREALDQILGLRSSEEQRAFNNATQAISTESDMRSAASDDALRRMVLETLQAQAGLEGDGSGVPAYGTPTGVGGAVAAGTDAQRRAASDAYLTNQGYDLNGDGKVSDGERRKSTTDKMAAIQKFKDTPDKSALPTVSIGGDWIVLGGADDRDGDGRGQAYNRVTGEIGYYNL
jgi:hypothetical protein